MMSESLLRVADVADEVVASYLYKLMSRVSDDRLFESAWFRVTPGRSSIPLELNEVNIIENPTFEVLVAVTETISGLAATLTEAAADMSERISVMPRAILVDQLSESDLQAGRWKLAAIPRIRLTPPLVDA